MKFLNLLSAVILTIFLTGSANALAQGGDDGGGGGSDVGGGHVLIPDSYSLLTRPELAELNATCTWMRANRLLTGQSYATYSEVMHSIAASNNALGNSLIDEIYRMRFCIVLSPLSRPTIRIGDRVFIDQQFYNDLQNQSRAMLPIREALRGLILH